MNIEEQRAIVATGLMKYKLTRRPSGIHGPAADCYRTKRTWMIANNYKPDLRCNQADDLKERLRELEISYKLEYSKSGKQHKCVVWYKALLFISYSDISEGAALLEAASKLAMELAKKDE